MLVDYLLQLLVKLFPLRQQFIEFGLSQHIPQGSLGYLRGSPDVVQDLNYRSLRVNHPEIHNGIYPDGNIVPGDYLLGRYIHRHHPQVNLRHPVNEGNDKK